MKATELIKELQHVIDTKGDLDCSISCSLSPEVLKRQVDQKYIISGSIFVVVEAYAKGHYLDPEASKEEIMIRDWPY